MPLDIGLPLANTERLAAQYAARAWAPPPPVDYSAWAEKNVVFGKESPRPGPYDPAYHPWDRFVLEALAPDHPARIVVLLGSAQTIGKTVQAQIFVGGSQDMDPGPIIYYHPTEQNALKWVKQKWKAFVKGTKVLLDLFPVGRSRDTSNSLLFQERADGRGWLQVSGANSESSLSQISAPRQIQDDLSKWEINTAGDPEIQADSRSEAFAWAKIFKIGTPLVKPGCRITADYERSTQGEFQVPCPHCGSYQALTWENFRASVDAIEEARKTGAEEPPPHFACVDCHQAIEQKHRAQIISPDKIRLHMKNPAGAKLAIYGFFVWAAYSPQKQWSDIAEAWLFAKGDPSREQSFFNDTLGLAYQVQGEAPPWEKLKERADASGLQLGHIPPGAIILAIGADCQGDRVEWHLKGFGTENRRWTIEYGVIEGHISEDKARAALDALLQRTWPDAFGNRRALDMLAIDGNYAKSDVHDWVKLKPQSRVIMVRGLQGAHSPELSLVREERTADGRVIKFQKRFWNVGVSPLKASLYKNLTKTDPTHRGYCAYPQGLNEEFFRQLTAERRMPVTLRNGATEWRWQKTAGQPNEVLDTEIYAEAAAIRLGWKRLSDEDWRRLTAERERPPAERQLDLEEPRLERSAADRGISAPEGGPDSRNRGEANAVRDDASNNSIRRRGWLKR